MNRTAFGILILVAGICVVLAFVGQNRGGSGTIAGDSAGSVLLTGLSDNLNGVSQILITGAGEQQLIGLQRTGEEWVVAEAGGYPAERSKVNALLIALAEAKILEEKTANPALHARLGVETLATPDAAGVEVSVIVENDLSYNVVLGDTYNTGQVYARIAASDQSVLIDRNPEIARDPSDWVVTEIINVDGDRVQRVEIMQADGEQLVIHKDSRAAANFDVDGVPDSRRLQYSGVANVSANLLESLQLDDVRPADDGLTGAMTVSEFWMFDGLVVTVTTAGEGDDAWLSFSARFDIDQALAFASDDVAGDLGATDAAEAINEANSAELSQEGARTEAENINRRLSAWRYRIPSYQISQLTRRVEDLLEPETTE